MPPSVPPIVRRLGWVSFFTDVAAEMVYPLLPALLRTFGTASIWLGTMEGIAEALSSFVKWRIGAVVDRAGQKKPLMVAGYALATVARPLIAFASAGFHVVVLRTLDRIGKGVRGVPRDALVAESVPKESLATAFAVHRMMDNAGSVLGPVVAFVLLRLLELETRVVILLAVVPGLVSVAVLVFGVREQREGAARATEEAAPALEQAPPAEPAPAGKLPADLWRYLAVLGLFTLGSSADSFLLLRAVEIGIPELWLPLMWLSLSGAKAASNLPGGFIADRFGRRRTLVAAWVLYAAFYAAVPHVTSRIAFAAVVIAYGTYYGLAEGAERAILSEHAPPALRGRAFGRMHAITGMAVLPANIGFGWLYSHSVVLAFTTSAACAAVAAALLAVLVKDPQAPEKDATLSA